MKISHSPKYSFLYKIFIIFLLLIVDVLGTLIAFIVASKIRACLIPWIGGEVSWLFNRPIVYLSMGFTVILMFFYNLYPGYGKTAVKEIEKSSYALTIVYGFLGIIVYFLELYIDFPRSIFVLAWFFSLILIPSFRILIRSIFSPFPWYGKPVLFIAHEYDDLKILYSILRCKRMGWNPQTIFLQNPTIGKEDFLGIEVVDSFNEVIKIKDTCSIDTVIYPWSTDTSREVLIRKLSTQFPSLVLVSSAFEIGSNWVRPRDLEGYLGLEIRYNLLLPTKLVVKRLSELILTTGVIIFSIPIWLVIMLLIRLDSKGPILYKHTRIGQHNNPIRLFKFRTMVDGADQKLEEYLNANPQARKEWEEHQKLSNDPRITRVGKYLRKFSLDELPQLINVIQGEMSLIGPRAVTAEELDKFGDYVDIILRVKPGITGWWQVMGRNETTWEERTKLEVYYVSNWSLWMDAYIALKTVWVMVSGQGK